MKNSALTNHSAKGRKAMRKKQIAIVISSLLATGLVGCNSATDNAAAPTAPAAAQSETKSSANVTFSAAFPAAGSAQAAVIDENATSIRIQVYATEVSNWGDYFSQQNNYGGYYDEYNGYGGYSEETLVSEFYLNAASPSQSVSLIPGPYRIIASQFDDAGLENNRPISEAVTLGELVSGDNSVVLNMLHGTWTFKDADNVDAPLELLLLNRTDLVDIDPDTEGQQPLDWDPSTPDTVESAAAALGLTEAPIKGVHLIGMPGLSGFDGYGEYASASAAGDVSPWEAIGRFGYGMFIRQDDGAGNEDVYTPSQYGQLCSALREQCTYMEGNVGVVLHEFDGATNTNIAHVDLGSMSISFSSYNGEYDTGNRDGFEAGLFTVARYEAQELGYGGYSDGPGEPVDDGTNYVYTPAPEENTYQWSTSYYNPDTGTYEPLYLANFSVDEEVISQPNDESPIFDLARETVATDGSTIVGSIVEYVVVGNSASNGYTGAEAPSYNAPGPAPVQVAAIRRALALDNIALKAGLKAKSANASGPDCRTLSFNNTNLSANYAWDEETSQWIAGEYNNSYYWNDTTISGDDLNGDGVVSVFETGVVRNLTYQETWDPDTSTYIPSGEDLDGDGTVEQFENVSAQQGNWDSTVEACIHPFTLKGGQLTYTVDTSVDVASE